MPRESVVAGRGVPGEALALPTPSQNNAGYPSRAPGPPGCTGGFYPLNLIYAQLLPTPSVQPVAAIQGSRRAGFSRHVSLWFLQPIDAQIFDAHI